MPDYIKINSDGSKTYPYNVQSLRSENPYTSFPENLEDVMNQYDVYVVLDTPAPEFNPIIQKVILITPEYKNGQYYQKWEIVNQTLEQAKSNALQRVDSQYAQIEEQGWNTGLLQGHLGITPNDVAMLSGAYLLAKEAANLGYPIPPIITMENQKIEFSDIQTMTTFMLQYGQYRSNISSVFAAKRRAVKNATTIDELDNL